MILVAGPWNTLIIAMLERTRWVEVSWRPLLSLKYFCSSGFTPSVGLSHLLTPPTLTWLTQGDSHTLLMNSRRNIYSTSWSAFNTCAQSHPASGPELQGHFTLPISSGPSSILGVYWSGTENNFMNYKTSHLRGININQKNCHTDIPPSPKLLYKPRRYSSG